MLNFISSHHQEILTILVISAALWALGVVTNDGTLWGTLGFSLAPLPHIAN